MLLAAHILAAQVEDVTFIPAGASWRYFKGSAPPPAGWNALDFDAGTWLEGPTGIGYGDDDDATQLGDMQGNYMAVFMRRRFEVTEATAVSALSLEVTYDDGFAAYLNGSEVARVNLADGAAFDAVAAQGIEPTVVTIDLASHLPDLRSGSNALAIEIHNVSLASTDLSMIPILKGRALTELARFSRGDGNTDGSVNVADAVFMLAHLFDDGPAPSCLDAEDTNDDGRINLIDAIVLLANLFARGPPLAEPRECGYDPTWEGEGSPLSSCSDPACP